MSDPAERWILVGTIAGSFGVRGELKVDLNTDFPDRFKSLKIVHLGTGRAPRTIEGVRAHQGRVLLRLEGVDTPEAAHGLRGTELWIPRSEAMPLPEGHYYLDDLLGVHVVTTDGRALGSITDVIRTGGNDVFVVNSGSAAILIPSIKDAVSVLDVAGRRIVVEPWILDTDD